MAFAQMASYRVPAINLYTGGVRLDDVMWHVNNTRARWLNLMDVTKLPGYDEADVTDEYVSSVLDALRPAVEALSSAGELHRAFVYGFDECALPGCQPGTDFKQHHQNQKKISFLPPPPPAHATSRAHLAVCSYGIKICVRARASERAPRSSRAPRRS